ncbi:MAG: DUF1552 domain-containing protein [Myxococcota bacterium]
MKPKNRFSRRSWLRMAAGAGAASLVPFMPRLARGQSEAPKRVLVVYHGLGYLDESFWPTRGASGRPNDFTLGDTMRALDDYKNQLIYLDGILLYGAQYFFPDDDNEHASGGNMTFTGSRKDDGDEDPNTKAFSNGPSFEQVIADHYYDPESPVTPFRDIALGISSNSTGERHACFFRGSQQPVAAQHDPTAAFETYFGGFTPADTSEAQRQQTARRRARNQSIIDYVRDDLDHARRRIGRQEEAALDQHLAGLRALERRVTAEMQADPACRLPDAPSGRWGGDAERLRGTYEAHVDVIASAFTCDLARVATLQLGHADGGLTLVEGINSHGTTHDIGGNQENPAGLADAKDRHRRLDRFWADRWHYLLEKLDSIPDGDGTLLDNTLIVWGTDTTTGPRGPHRHTRMPYFLAGGSNWAFPTGRHLVYDQVWGRNNRVGREEAAQWQSNSRIWVSILQRYGIERDSFGTMDIGSGTLPDL